MRKRVMALAVLSTLLLTSCENKTAVGTIAGAALGAGAGALIAHHAGQGALVGGAIGAAAGLLVGAALDEQDRERVNKKSPSTVSRIDRGEQLDTYDVKQMASAGLSDDVIIGQIEATKSVYHLSTSDIIALKNAGVSQKVIDYMIETGNR
jgi:outer membrane lipoprotein SlyB